MIQVNIKDNFKGVADALKREPMRAVSEFDTAIRKSVVKVQSEATRRAPVNKSTGGGNLRQSIRGKVERLAGRVEVQAGYALFVHEGTRPHEIRPKNKRVLADTRHGKFFGKLVKHPGTRAQPFLRQAVDASLAMLKKYFAEALENIAALK